MANHVANRITAGEDAIAAIREVVRSDEQAFDFNRLIRMPAHRPGSFFAEGDLGRVDEEKNPRGNWFDWARRCWWTKWNAYAEDDARNDATTIYFETAWAFPMPILCALAARLPEITFVWEYADEDFGRNLGIIRVERGEITWLPDPEDPVDFAKRLHGREDE